MVPCPTFLISRCAVEGWVLIHRIRRSPCRCMSGFRKIPEECGNAVSGITSIRLGPQRELKLHSAMQTPAVAFGMWALVSPCDDAMCWWWFRKPHHAIAKGALGALRGSLDTRVLIGRIGLPPFGLLY